MSGKIPPRIDDLFTASAGVDDYGSDQPFEDFCLPRLPIYPNETETPYRVTMPLPNNRSYTTYLIGAAKTLLRPPPANDEEDDVHISVATTRDRHFCSRAVILKDGKIVDELFRSNAENDSAEAALEDLIFLMHKFGAEVNDDPPLHREELLSEYRYCWKLSVDINERADVINEAVARKTANDGVGASVEAGTTAPPTVQKSNENDNPVQAAGSSKTKKRNEARKRAKARKKEAGSQGDEASGNTVMLAE